MIDVRTWLIGSLIGIVICISSLCAISGCLRALTRDQDVHNELDATDTIKVAAGASVDIEKITTQVSTTVSNEMWPIMVLVICWVVFDTIKTFGLGWLIIRLRYTREKRKWNVMCGHHGANPPADR